MIITKPPKPKLYHRAGKMRSDGAVSALCFKRPRPIDLRKALWTVIDLQVTCPKCRELIEKRKKKITGATEEAPQKTENP